MSEMSVDTSKRRFLVTMSSAVGGVAALGVASPFVLSMMPSARAKAAGAPVEVDLSKVEPGMLLAVEWRGKPVWVVNRTKEMLDMLAKNDEKLTDAASENTAQQPDYCKNPTRSIKPEYLIVVGICTHLGCSPLYVPELVPQAYDAEWKGGFYCPCHQSRFDLAGRVFQGVPAPSNLEVPPYHFIDDNHIMVGVAPEGGA